MIATIRYLAAALAASLCFVLLTSAQTLWTILRGRASIQALSSDLSFAPTYLAITLLVVLPVGVPFVLTVAWLARYIRADGYAYWIGTAAGSAMVASALVVWGLSGNFPSIGGDGSGLNFAAEWWRLARLAIPSGAAGGLVFRSLSTRASV